MDPFNETNSNTSTTEQVDALAQLVGDGKKFKTVDDLAKGKLQSDTYIEQLQSETAQYRQMLESNTERDQKVDQIFELLSKRSDPQETQNTMVNEQNTTVTEPSGSSKPDGMFSSPEDLDKYVTKLIEGRETAGKANANLAEVQSKLTEKYSDKSPDFIKTRASELGITVEDMKSLAERSPAAFYRMMGMDTSKESSLSFADSIKSAEANTKESDGTTRNREWWNTQRRTKGNSWFLRPENQKMYFADANTLGSKFN